MQLCQRTSSDKLEEKTNRYYIEIKEFARPLYGRGVYRLVIEYPTNFRCIESRNTGIFFKFFDLPDVGTYKERY